MLRSCGDKQKTPTDGVTFGVIEMEGQEDWDLQAEVNDIVTENQFQVFIDTLVHVELDGHFEPLIQNSDVNKNPCWVELIDDDGSVIYVSDMIRPGYKIERDILNNSIAQGKHDCQAVFHVLRSESKSDGEVSSVVVNVTLVQR